MIFDGLEIQYHLSLACAVTSAVALLGSLLLRCMKEPDGNAGVRLTPQATGSMLIYVIMLPFGLGSSRLVNGFGGIGAAVVATIWANVHSADSVDSSFLMTAVMPSILLATTLGACVRTRLGQDHTQLVLALVTGGYAIILLVTGTLLKQTYAPAAPAVPEAPAVPDPGEAPEHEESELSQGVELVPVGGEGEGEEDIWLGGPPDQPGQDVQKWAEFPRKLFYKPAGLFWIMAAFVFLNGTTALVALGSLFPPMLKCVIDSKEKNKEACVYIVAVAAVTVVTCAVICRVNFGILWPEDNRPTGSAAIVSIVALPLALLLHLTSSPQASNQKNLGHFIVYGWMIPFGFAGAFATLGVLAPLSVFLVGFWALVHRNYTVPLFVLPALSLVAGALLLHGGHGPVLMSGTARHLVPACVAGAFGLVLMAPGILDRNIPLVDRQKLHKAGGLTLLSALAYLSTGIIGLCFLLAEVSFSFIVSIASVPDPDPQMVLSFWLALAHLVASLIVAGLEGNFTGIFTENVLSCFVIVSCSSAVILLGSMISRWKKRARQEGPAEEDVIPAHIRDFLALVCVVGAGLVGSPVTNGIYGCVVLVGGALWALFRGQSLVVCLILPLMGFWAGASLNAAVGNANCLTIGGPTLGYGVMELVVSLVLKSCGKDFVIFGEDVPSTWANPPGLSHAPRTMGSALELSGWLFTAVGGSVALYCPGHGGGVLGLAGEISYVFILLLAGIWLLRRGLILRDVVEESDRPTRQVTFSADQQSGMKFQGTPPAVMDTGGVEGLDVGDVVYQYGTQSCTSMSAEQLTAILEGTGGAGTALQPQDRCLRVVTKAVALQNVKDAAARGYRMRLGGLLMMNLSIWFSVGAGRITFVKALITIVGSLATVLSGCVSYNWKQSVDAVPVAETLSPGTAAPAPAVPVAPVAPAVPAAGVTTANAALVPEDRDASVSPLRPGGEGQEGEEKQAPGDLSRDTGKAATESPYLIPPAPNQTTPNVIPSTVTLAPTQVVVRPSTAGGGQAAAAAAGVQTTTCIVTGPDGQAIGGNALQAEAQVSPAGAITVRLTAVPGATQSNGFTVPAGSFIELTIANPHQGGRRI